MDQWIIAAAAVVQGLAAITIAVLTRRLAGATDRYAKSADDQSRTTVEYAETAQKQYAEMVEARETQFRPFIHVDVPGLSQSFSNGHVDEVKISLPIVNLGPGVALSVRARFYYQLFTLGPNVRALAMGDRDRRDIEFEPARGVARLAPGEQLPRKARVVVKYRDVLDRWWKTELGFNVGGIPGRDGSIRFEGFTPLDQDESFSRIDPPSNRAQEQRPQGDDDW